ncbi:MAG: sulfotransferase [Alteraurantiacibacter sp.]
MAVPPRPHLLARSPRVDRINGWLETLWRKGYAPPPTLDPQEMWDKALAKHQPGDERGGREDRDVADFRERLDYLCQAARDEAALNPLGRTMAHGQLQRVVFQRLQLGQIWRRDPSILQSRLAPPIVVLGQQRSGTTRIQRLLARDPALDGTRFCDSWNPVPRRPDTRPLWSGISLRIGRWLNPWVDTIHPMGGIMVDEELGWLAAALGASTYEAQWHIPSYSRFNEARDAGPLYREFARILRTDARFHDTGARPRVLKVPQFTEDIDSLLGVFPDARIVQTRRDADKVGASMTSMFANQMAIQSDEVDLGWIEGEVVRKMALREQRITSQLATFEGPLAVVDFAALDADWEGAIARLYDELGQDFTPAARAAMRDEHRRAAAAVHRGHAFHLAAASRSAGS